MIRVAIQEQIDNEDIFDLNLLQKKLKRIYYHGQITLVYQKGELVLIREERTLKPNQLDQI